MINIGIDITPIIYNRGVSRYTSNLVQALFERKDVKLSLFGSSFRQKKTLKNFVSKLKSKEYKLDSFPPDLLSKLWHLGLYPIKKSLPKINLFHSWDWLQPPDKNMPLVSTIHDLAILKFPDTAHPKIVKMHQRSWKILKKRKAHIIAVSQTTKRDIIKLLGFPASRVHVVHEALPQESVVAGESISEEEYETTKNYLQLNKPYLLFVGTREPRKNLANLIKAWQPLSGEYELIIAGEKGWDATQSSSKASSKSPRFLGKVTDQELAVLYSEANLFVYPSLYEGFGLPILEAFHFGTPVVTSNISSMPEVAGNAAELVDPNSPSSIRKGIKKILGESSIEQRKRLQKMIIRLQLFSWKHVAQQTLDVYKKALIDYQASS